VATDTKKSGLTLPTGILQPTTLPETARPARVDPPQPAGQGGDVSAEEGPEPAKASKAPKKARGKAAAAGAEKVEGLKLYLTEDVRFRLRMLAFQRGKKISTVANEVLDRNLPRWSLERTE
jgi:hypothetical protein